MMSLGSIYITPGKPPVWETVPESRLAAVMTTKHDMGEKVYYYIFLVDIENPYNFDQITTDVIPWIEVSRDGSFVSKSDILFIAHRELKKIFGIPKELPFIYDRTIMCGADVQVCINDFRLPSSLTAKFTRI